MTNDISAVVVTGRLTRDVDVRYTQSGTAVANFAIAQNRRKPDGSDEVTFVDIAMWGKRAEAFARFHSKGDRCLLEGRLTMDEWEDKNGGGRRTKLKMTAENWEFFGERKF